MSEQDLLRVKEFIEKNYPPQPEYFEEDELMQKMDELEEAGFPIGKSGSTMSVMTSLPATERVLVTINEMAKILGIGHNTIRRLVRENPTADYIFTQGTRVYLKREMFINIVLGQSTI